jgi:voltage-gated potassium channel
MRLKEKIKRLLNDNELKSRLYEIIFEADTPMGKFFDVLLVVCIIMSIVLAIAESVQSRWEWFNVMMVVCEYIFTLFFTFEYLTRIYCSPSPKRYIFSFFGIVDLLATLPLYISRCALFVSDSCFPYHTRLPYIQTVQLLDRGADVAYLYKKKR